MKIVRSKTLLPEALVLGCLALCLVFPAYGKWHEVDGVDTLVNFNGKNGAQPQSVLEDSAGNFYGTTLSGGKYGKGTVYEILQDGQLVTLVNFNGANGSAPEAGLVLGPDGSLYGTTKTGGTDGKGTVFRISPDGKFSTVVSFAGNNGSNPDSGLFLTKDGSIYGSTLNGGADGKGTIFKISPNGKLTTVFSFNGLNGSNPGSLALGNNGDYYGTTNKGGSADKGTLFDITPDGRLTILVTFSGPNGAFPVSGLIVAEDGTFYGATLDGGKNNLGTVYKFTSDGKFSTVVSFNGTNGSHPDSGLVEWSNGYFYMVRLMQNILVKSANVQWAGDNFCGTTSSGGTNGIGTVYRVGDDGQLVTLVSFSGERGIDLGANPNCLVPGEDGNLYGTTTYGGHDSLGTVFRLQLQLWILPVDGSDVSGDAGYHDFKPHPVSP